MYLPNRKSIRLKNYDYSSTHIHMIIIIVGATRGLPSPHPLEGRSRPAPTELGTIIGLFKSECSKQIHVLMHNPQFPVWQRNYFEHIIRNDIELGKVREYISLNPLMWDRDRNNPKGLNYD